MHFPGENIYDGLLKMILLIYVLIFGCAGSSSLCWLFSSCSEQELVSSCSVWASHPSASFVVDHRIKGMQASVGAAGGLSGAQAQ